MSGSSSLNQLQSEAVVRRLKHMESLSERQITKNIHGQVVAPISHVARARPALGVGTTISNTNLLAESTNIAKNVALHLLHGRLREGVRQDTALACVDFLVTGVVGVGDGVGKGIVELGLADVGLEAVDLLEGGVGVEGDGVGAESNDFA